MEKSQAEAQTLDEIGSLYFAQNCFQAARESWKEALQIYQESNNRRSMAVLYSNIGTACREEGTLREAIRFYQKSLVIDRDFENREGVLFSLHNLGSVWLVMAEFEHAAEAFGEALDVAREANSGDWEAEILYRLGHAHRHLYRFQEAYEFFNSGLKVAEKNQNLSVMTLNVNGLGALYEDIGEYQQALRCYQDAITGAQHLEDPHLQVETLTRLAALKLHIGSVDEAREIARSAHELISPEQASHIRIELDLLRSEIYYSRGMKEKSITLLQGILNQNEHLSNRNGLIKAKIQQASMEMDRNHTLKALEIVLPLHKAQDMRLAGPVEIEKLIVLSRIFRQMEQSEEAETARESAVLKAEEMKIPRYLWLTHYLLGRMMDDQAHYQSAREEYERAETCVYRTAISLDPELRKIFLEHRERQTLYQDYVLILLRMGHKEQAMRVLSRVGSDNLYRKLKNLLEE